MLLDTYLERLLLVDVAAEACQRFQAAILVGHKLDHVLGMDTSVPTLDVQKSHPGILEVEDGIDLVRYIDYQGRNSILDLVGPKAADHIACNVEGRSHTDMASHSDHTIVSCLG
ncbi:hypothetical protein BG005_010381 [Podila minutissima]|nr:hypothetical protein BG005_010381 [Podila minutissima]